MENPRPEKVTTVAEITAKFRGADAAILTEYRGMSVSQMADVRRALRPVGGEWKVYKNTLARIAARETGAGELASQLAGALEIEQVCAATQRFTQQQLHGSMRLMLPGESEALVPALPDQGPLPSTMALAFCSMATSSSDVALE